MAIVISGSGIDMGGNPVSNASQVDSTVINENGDNVISQGELAYDVDTSSYIPNTLASGAIIERGSNANGEYIKYADGTLICTYKRGISVTTTNVNGGIYFSGGISLTFPHAFVADSIPKVSSTTRHATNGIVWGTVFTPITNTSCTMVAISGISNGNGYLEYIAIGKWN